MHNKGKENSVDISRVTTDIIQKVALLIIYYSFHYKYIKKQLEH